MTKPLLYTDSLPEELKSEFEEYNLNELTDPLKQKLESYAEEFLTGVAYLPNEMELLIEVEPVFKISRYGNKREIKGLVVNVFDDTYFSPEDDYYQAYSNIQNKEKYKIGAIGLNLITAAINLRTFYAMDASQ